MEMIVELNKLKLIWSALGLIIILGVLLFEIFKVIEHKGNKNSKEAFREEFVTISVTLVMFINLVVVFVTSLN